MDDLANQHDPLRGFWIRVAAAQDDKILQPHIRPPGSDLWIGTSSVNDLIIEVPHESVTLLEAGTLLHLEPEWSARMGLAASRGADVSPRASPRAACAPPFTVVGRDTPTIRIQYCRVNVAVGPNANVYLCYHSSREEAAAVMEVVLEQLT